MRKVVLPERIAV